jgi:hypothetical protein
MTKENKRAATTQQLRLLKEPSTTNMETMVAVAEAIE